MYWNVITITRAAAAAAAAVALDGSQCNNSTQGVAVRQKCGCQQSPGLIVIDGLTMFDILKYATTPSAFKNLLKTHMFSCPTICSNC